MQYENQENTCIYNLGYSVEARIRGAKQVHVSSSAKFLSLASRLGQSHILLEILQGEIISWVVDAIRKRSEQNKKPSA